VQAVPNHPLALSSSYDKTVAVWLTAGARAVQLGALVGCTAPVLELQYACSTVAAGDRGGGLAAWDLGAVSSSSGGSSSSRSGGVRGSSSSAAAVDPVWSCTGAHQGHVTALTWSQATAAAAAGGAGGGDGVSGGSWQMSGGGGGKPASASALLLSGGQDGCVRAWDVRSRASSSCAAECRVHASSKGKGAVSGIVAAGERTVVSAGADGALAVLDLRGGSGGSSAGQGSSSSSGSDGALKPLATVELPDFPYSLAAAGGLAFCGCGDGSACVVDVAEGRLLYALGANKAAVRAVDVGVGGVLVCGGDDGSVVSYDFGDRLV